MICHLDFAIFNFLEIIWASPLGRAVNNKSMLSKNAIDWAHKHSWDKISLKYIKAINRA